GTGMSPSGVADRHEGGNRVRPTRGWVENRGDPGGDLIRCGLGHARNEIVLAGIDRPLFPSLPARYDGRAVSSGYQPRAALLTSVRRHRRAQGGSSMLRSIRPTRARVGLQTLPNRSEKPPRPPPPPPPP